MGATLAREVSREAIIPAACERFTFTGSWIRGTPAIIHTTGAISAFPDTFFPRQNEILWYLFSWKRAMCWLA